MIPIIALVGKKNVGKSTLFNKLTETNNALVSNFPGLTQDRQYGHCKWNGYKFIIVDTPSIDNIKKENESIIVKQSIYAIKQANIVLLITDRYYLLDLSDKEISNFLYKKNKIQILVINKVNITDNFIEDNFLYLGIKNVVFTSSINKKEINILMGKIFFLLYKKNFYFTNKNNFSPKTIKNMNLENKKFSKESNLFLPKRIVIIGSPNVGKSTIANKILGEDRMSVQNTPGTTRDSIHTAMIYNKKKYILVDTAGIRKPKKIKSFTEKISFNKSMESIKYSSLVLLVIDAVLGITDQELSLIDFIINKGKPIIIVVNKCDLLSKKIKKYVKSRIVLNLNFAKFIKIHFISAINNEGIKNLLKSVIKTSEVSTNRISTGLLNKVMIKATNEMQPPIINGFRTKLKYAHIGKYNPITIIIHGSKVNNITNNYKRYLINYFTRSLKISGIPIKISFNENS